MQGGGKTEGSGEDTNHPNRFAKQGKPAQPPATKEGPSLQKAAPGPVGVEAKLSPWPLNKLSVMDLPSAVDGGVGRAQRHREVSEAPCNPLPSQPSL